MIDKDSHEFADDLLETARLAKKVNNVLLQKALEMAENGEVKDPTSAARNASVVLGISVEKRQLLLERPTQIHAPAFDPHAAGLELIKMLGIKPPIDATATEIPPEQPKLPPSE